MLQKVLDPTLIFTQDWVFYTLQGEGKYQGHPCVFVRLSTCNLRCHWKNANGSSTLCDTPYSSFAPEQNGKSISETIEKIESYNTKQVVLTGGEPFYQPQFYLLLKELKQRDFFVTVETNGTIFDSKAVPFIDFLSISPKLRSTGNKNVDYGRLSALSQWIDAFPDSYQLKFVYHEEKDIEEIEKIIQDVKADSSKIFLMPMANCLELLEQNFRAVVDVCKKLKWNYSDRMHLRIWKGQRGN